MSFGEFFQGFNALGGSLAGAIKGNPTADVGRDLQAGNYDGAASKLFDAGQLDAGLKVLSLGQTAKGNAEFDKRFDALSPGGGYLKMLNPDGGQPDTAPQGPKAPSFTGGRTSMQMPADPDVERTAIDTWRSGGLTNPFGLAALAAHAGAESGFSPKNIAGSWSDPSQSGGAGTSGGLLSWRDGGGTNRFSQMRAATAGADNPVVAQAKYALVENPDVTARLQNAKSLEEANSILAGSQRYAGWDRPGGETANRLASAQAYLGRFGGAPQGAPAGSAPSTAPSSTPAPRFASGFTPSAGPVPQQDGAPSAGAPGPQGAPGAGAPPSAVAPAPGAGGLDAGTVGRIRLAAKFKPDTLATQLVGPADLQANPGFFAGPNGQPLTAAELAAKLEAGGGTQTADAGAPLPPPRPPGAGGGLSIQVASADPSFVPSGGPAPTPQQAAAAGTPAGQFLVDRAAAQPASGLVPGVPASGLAPAGGVAQERARATAAGQPDPFPSSGPSPAPAPAGAPPAARPVDMSGDFPVRMPDGRTWTRAQAAATEADSSPAEEDVEAAQNAARRQGGGGPATTGSVSPQQVSQAAPAVMAKAGFPAGAVQAIAATPSPEARVMMLTRMMMIPGASEQRIKVAGVLLSNELDQTKLPEDVKSFLFAKSPAGGGFTGSLSDWRSKSDPDTADTKNFAAYARGEQAAGRVPKSFGEFLTDIKRAGATKITNTVDTKGAGKFAEVANDLQAKRYEKMVNAADDAVHLKSDIDTLAQLGEQIATGKLSDARLGLAQYAKAAGLDSVADGLTGGKLSEMEAYQSITDKLSPRMRVPGSGATSDYEMRVFKNSLPSLLKTPQGNRIVVDTFRSLYDYQMAAGELAGQAIRGEIPQKDADKQLRDLESPFQRFKDYRKTMPSDGTSGGSEPVKVRSPDEARGLKPGTKFQVPDGRVFER